MQTHTEPFYKVIMELVTFVKCHSSKNLHYHYIQADIQHLQHDRLHCTMTYTKLWLHLLQFQWRQCDTVESVLENLVRNRVPMDLTSGHQTAVTANFEGTPHKNWDEINTRLHGAIEMYLLVHNLYSAWLPNQYPTCRYILMMANLATWTLNMMQSRRWDWFQFWHC